MAAVGVDYPHKTLVLDDGRRDEVRKIAEEFNCEYVVRKDNQFHKAGNLNNALKFSKSEFVAMFDADFVAMPHALHSLLGFFQDEKVCMAQAPQDFYNVNNAFSYLNNKKTGALWMDQSFFYHVAMPCQDAREAGTGLGTAVIYRRSGLDEIGGIPTATVTEDMHTSLRLHKLGYKTVYLNEPVAYGVDAVDLNEFYKTRLRWAHGNIHVLKEENVLFCKGLTLGQRLSYLTLGIIYLEGWQQLILFLVPTISLLFGIPPFEISIFNVFIILFYPVIGYLLLQEMGCGFSRYWTNELFSLARYPVYLLSWRALFNFKMTWLISAKNLKGKVNLALISPQLTVLLLSITALTYGIIRLVNDFKTGPIADAIVAFLTGGVIPDIHAKLIQGYSLELVVVSGFFAFYNGVRAIFMIRKAMRDARLSEEDYSFDIRLPAEINFPGKKETIHATTNEISISKIILKTQSANLSDCGTAASIKLYLPTGPINLDFEVYNSDQQKGFWDQTAIDIKLGEVESILKGKIDWEGQEAKDKFMKTLLSLDWQREIINRNAYFLTPLEFIQKVLTFKNPFKVVDHRWKPAILDADEDRNKLPVFMSDQIIRKVKEEIFFEHQLLTFREFEIGENIEISKTSGSQSLLYKILEQIPVDSLGEKGLDGACMGKYRARLISNLNSSPNFS
jgi:cellulose synthase/poly-beta-1,6-N-acetylglucosamine synthase-like glycosyltransferase